MGYETANIIGGINDSADKQNRITTNLTPKLAALNDPYKQQSLGAATGAQDEARARSASFLNDVGSSSDKIGENLSQALLRRTMQGSQQQSQQLREQLGSTGGLQNGASSAAFGNLAGQTANNLYEGNNNIINQQLQARQDAMGKAYDVDQNLITNKLGISQDTLAKLYASGRQDLIDEANSLMGIEQNRSGAVQGAQVNDMNANLAKESADRNSRNALLGSVLNVGGQIYGAKSGGSSVRGTTASV
jgi:hypothetical protein